MAAAISKRHHPSQQRISSIAAAQSKNSVSPLLFRKTRIMRMLCRHCSRIA